MRLSSASIVMICYRTKAKLFVVTRKRITFCS